MYDVNSQVFAQLPRRIPIVFKKLHIHILALVSLSLFIGACLIYYYQFRYFRAINRYQTCRTSTKLDRSNHLLVPLVGLENVENVTIFYRNEDHPHHLSRCPLVDGRRILISYASDCCEQSQVINCDSGLQIGGFDMCLLFGPGSIDESFRKRHIDPLLAMSSRGDGFWSWKPYIILRTLLAMDDGDVLFYADSGSEFIANVDIGLICLQAQLKQDVVLFQLEHLERQYTKADAFVLVGCETKNCTDTRQMMASFILLRKSFFSIQFVSTWLAYATDPRAISDLPSRLEKESPHFLGHRHDQSLLSLVAKRFGLADKAWTDPSQFGNEDRILMPEKHYFINRQYILHTRIKA